MQDDEHAQLNDKRLQTIRSIMQRAVGSDFPEEQLNAINMAKIILAKEGLTFDDMFFVGLHRPTAYHRSIDEQNEEVASRDAQIADLRAQNADLQREMAQLRRLKDVVVKPVDGHYTWIQFKDAVSRSTGHSQGWVAEFAIQVNIGTTAVHEWRPKNAVPTWAYEKALTLQPATLIGKRNQRWTPEMRTALLEVCQIAPRPAYYELATLLRERFPGVMFTENSVKAALNHLRKDASFKVAPARRARRPHKKEVLED